MAKLRKLWSTTQGPEASSVAELKRRRHESRSRAYGYVDNDAGNYACGSRYSFTDVWVNERDGHGWRLYERIEHARTEG